MCHVMSAGIHQILMILLQLVLKEAVTSTVVAITLKMHKYCSYCVVECVKMMLM